MQLLSVRPMLSYDPKVSQRFNVVMMELRRTGPTVALLTQKATLELLLGNPDDAVQSMRDAYVLTSNEAESNETMFLCGIARAVQAAILLGVMTAGPGVEFTVPPKERKPRAYDFLNESLALLHPSLEDPETQDLAIAIKMALAGEHHTLRVIHDWVEKGVNPYDP